MLGPSVIACSAATSSRPAPVGTGQFLPLSAELVGGYTSVDADNSRRRARVEAEIKAVIDDDLDEHDITVVTVSRQR